MLPLTLRRDDGDVTISIFLGANTISDTPMMTSAATPHNFSRDAARLHPHKRCMGKARLCREGDQLVDCEFQILPGILHSFGSTLKN